MLTRVRHRALPAPQRAAGSGGAAAGIAVAGAHGGAGATTLAVLLGAERDLGVISADERDWPDGLVHAWQLVLVSRNTAAAAARALAAVNAIAGLGGHVAVLAVVGDGLPEPAAAAYRFRVISARVGVVVRVPFVAALRSLDDPAQVVLPRGARRALAKIRAAALVPSARVQPVNDHAGSVTRCR